MKKWFVEKWNYVVWKIQINYLLLKTGMNLKFMRDNDLITEQNYGKLEAKRQEILRKSKTLGGVNE